MLTTQQRRAAFITLAVVYLIGTVILWILFNVTSRSSAALDDEMAAAHMATQLQAVLSPAVTAQEWADSHPGEHAVATIQINADGAAIPIDSRIFGANLPSWLNPNNLADATFRARTVATGITVLRMPGGSWGNTYGWLSCELGQNQANVQPCGSGWAAWAAKPSDFISFLEATATQGMWVVNPNGTEQEAAAVVAFFNAQTDSTTPIGVDRNGFDWQTAGHWAQLRADHGHPATVGMKLWAVGNEVYGGKPGAGGAQCQSWGWEEVWTCDGTEYVNGAGQHTGYTAFRAAMRAVDPTIAVGAVGLTPSNDYSNWGNEVVAAAGATMDFYDIHYYGFFDPPANNAAALAAPPNVWPTIMSDVRNAYQNHAGGRSIPTAITEYNLFSVQDKDNQQLMTRAVDALYIADTIGQLIQQGVVIANQWDLANGRAGNGTEYGLMHVDNSWYRSPQYYVFPLWTRFGSELLPTSSSFDAATQVSVYGGRLNATTFSLLAINKTNQAQAASITINAGGNGVTVTGGEVNVMAAASLNAQAVTFNAVSDPANDLSNAPASPLNSSDEQVSYTFAPNSITLLHLETNAPTLTPTATATTTATGEATPMVTPTATPTLVATTPALDDALFLPFIQR
ncbi:MAG: hypothetical protein R3C14_13685 [Caldilineaceae bacterium]